LITNETTNKIPTVAQWFETQRESVKNIENYKVIFSYLEIVRKSYKELKGFLEAGSISNNDFVGLMKEFNIWVFHDIQTGRLVVGEINDNSFSEMLKETHDTKYKADFEKLRVEVYNRRIHYKDFMLIDTLNFNFSKVTLKANKEGNLLEKNDEDVFQLLQKKFLKAIDINEENINTQLNQYSSMKMEIIDFFQDIVTNTPSSTKMKLQAFFEDLLQMNEFRKNPVLSENFLQTVHLHKAKDLKTIEIGYSEHRQGGTSHNVVGNSSRSILSLLLLEMNYPTEYPSVIVSDIDETYNLEREYPVGFQAEHKLTDSFIYFLKEIEGETGKRVSEFSSTEVGVVEQKINTYLKTMRHRVNKFPYAQKHNHYQDRVFVKFIKENATISKEQG
jgi:hypothetical protein